MGFDLDAYLARIGHDGEPPEPTLDTLRALHLEHATSIPFENVDVQLGRPIALDVQSLQEKLVANRRGGYCFEHNRLFATALEAIGFDVTCLAARVRMGRAPDAEPLPRTHMVLAVDVGGSRWLADVGFGGDGLLAPLPLEPGPPVHTLGRTHRVVRGDETTRLVQLLRAGEWLDLYAFTLEPQLPVDYELANWWSSTHPSSGFVLHLTAQRVRADGSTTLRDRTLTTTTPDGAVVSTRELRDDAEVVLALRDEFGIELAPETHLRAVALAGGSLAAGVRSP